MTGNQPVLFFVSILFPKKGSKIFPASGIAEIMDVFFRVVLLQNVAVLSIPKKPGAIIVKSPPWRDKCCGWR